MGGDTSTERDDGRNNRGTVQGRNVITHCEKTNSFRPVNRTKETQQVIMMNSISDVK